jgi:hypothetical protein
LWPDASIGKRERKMAKMVLDFSDEDQMRIEAILMDNDAQEALRFLKDVIRPKIRAKGSRELDAGKSTGVQT